MANSNSEFIKFFYAGIIITVFIVSCNNYDEHQKTVANIPTTDTLFARSTYHLSDTTQFFHPLSMLNVNDQYLVINEYLNNDFLKVFSIPDFNIAYSWGRKGRGPGEFMVPPTDLGATEDGMYIFDPLSQSLKIFSVTDSTLLYKEEQSLNYSGQVTPLNRIRRINKELYFADYGGDNAISPDDENYEHIALQPENTKPLFTFGEYPESKLKGFDKYAKHLKSNWVKPDGKLFVTAYLSASNRIKIFSTNGKLQEDITVIDPNSSSQEEDYLFRNTAWASNNYIYFLGMYDSEENIYASEPDSTQKTYLEIWDWEGNPISRYSFDKFIKNYTVSERLGKIYGFSPLSDDQLQLFEYDLPNLD